MRKRVALAYALWVAVLCRAAAETAPTAGAEEAASASRADTIGPSDVLRYRAQRFVGAAEAPVSASIVLVHGFEFRGSGRAYLPAAATAPDIPRWIAFHPTPDGASEATLELAAGERINAAIRTEVHRTADPTSVEYSASWRLEGGVASGWQATSRTRRMVDGVTASASVTIRAGDSVPTTWTFDLLDRRQCRHPGFDAEVGSAIDRGVAWIRTMQKPDGSFGPYRFHRVGDMTPGHSALCAYTLMACGVSVQDACVQRTLAWLTYQDVRTTYEAAITLLALERALGVVASKGKLLPGAPAGAASAKSLHERLLQLQGESGGWGYGQAERASKDYADLSNTQMAALGLRAGVRMGFVVPPRAWADCRRYVASHRSVLPAETPPAVIDRGASDRGVTRSAPRPVTAAGYGYFEPKAGAAGSDWRSTASMTLAAISTLATIRDHTFAGGAERTSIDADIVAAWTWMDRHWAVDRCAFLADEGPGWTLYTLWSLERAADLDGVRRVSGKDWYYDGATEILERQRGDGSWPAGFSDESSTCFALLFLARSAASATRR